MKIVNTLHQHIQKPGESVEAYARRKRIELGRDIQFTPKVYLDTKFWVFLRDARMGRPSSDHVVKLVQLLEALVSKRLVVCPISLDTFVEMFHQTDPKTLSVTAQLVDDLSMGVAMLTLDERIRLEVFHFVREKTIGAGSVYSPNELVWTKMANVWGFMMPSCDVFPADLDTVMQKAFVDQMWSITLADMLDQLGPKAVSSIPRFNDIAPKLNQGKFAHLDDCSSFKQLFFSELAGILEEYKPVFKDLMTYIYEADTGQRPTADELSADDSGRMLANLIYHAFRQNKINTELPSFHVYAGLHAAVRWDTKRKYKPNDLHDFHHLVAAVPYCDYFLTENSLRHLVRDKNLNLSALFRCQTFSDASDAVATLSQLGT